MIGAAVIVVVLIVAIPVAVMLSGSIVALVTGWVLQRDVDDRNEGSELLDLNG